MGRFRGPLAFTLILTSWSSTGRMTLFRGFFFPPIDSLDILELGDSLISNVLLDNHRHIWRLRWSMMRVAQCCLIKRRAKTEWRIELDLGNNIYGVLFRVESTSDQYWSLWDLKTTIDRKNLPVVRNFPLRCIDAEEVEVRCSAHKLSHPCYRPGRLRAPFTWGFFLFSSFLFSLSFFIVRTPRCILTVM